MKTPFAFPLTFIVMFASLLTINGCSLMSSQTSAPTEFSQQANTSEPKKTLRLATITPVIKSMTEALVADTPMEVVYLPSNRYSIKRLPGWLKKQDYNSFPSVDAIIGISSLRPDLDAYPEFRLHNIGVVPIDLAHALIPGGERVAITHSSQDSRSSAYFWLNPSNALIMLGILHRDLNALVENKIQQEELRASTLKMLAQNRADITQALRTIQIELDQKLMETGVMQVTTDKPELQELLAATLLPDVTLQEARSGDFPTLLITSRKRSHKSFRELPQHISVWSVDDFGKVRKNNFQQRWLDNLSKLN